MSVSRSTLNIVAGEQLLLVLAACVMATSATALPGIVNPNQRFWGSPF